jgi:hypothetical protein
MVALTARVKFYLYAQATDMRKSFDGLCGVVTSALGRDPTSGDVYVFINRRRDRMKLFRVGSHRLLVFLIFYVYISDMEHVAPQPTYDELLAEVMRLRDFGEQRIFLPASYEIAAHAAGASEKLRHLDELVDFQRTVGNAQMLQSRPQIRKEGEREILVKVEHRPHLGQFVETALNIIGLV